MKWPPRTRRTAALPEQGRARRAQVALWAAGSVVLASLGAGMAPTAAHADTGRAVDVIVTGPSTSVVAAAVTAAGGTVTSELPLIDGVTATLPEGAELSGNLLVTPDRPVTFAADELSPSVAASTIRSTVGLPPSGDEGQGVTVAVVDTGVADVPDLAGSVVGHIDVTGTGGGDGYGHGTFMAGLIAGSGAASGGAFQGVAPGAKILDVKVSAQDGTTDLGSVLDGLQAVAKQGRQYNVSVLNLSLSSGSPAPYQVDPLNQALRALWHRGVTVVVSSGNTGPGAGTVSAPGNDPTLLTVGGINEHGTAERADDDIAAWSGRGPTPQGISKPDLAAPGQSVIGLRSPGSVVDNAFPHARVGDGYFRGSGTSMSAAVASGAVAGVLARNSQLRPDDVKRLLLSTTYQADGLTDVQAAGRGGLDAGAALALAPSAERSGASQPSSAPGDPATWKALAEAIEAEDADAAARSWAALDPQARSWAARSWAALDPQARSWAARSWAARSWAARSWAGEEWAARSWAARSWAGDDWSARSWAARSWAGEDWSARSWAARSWAARSWAARSWAGDDWAARSWAGERWSARSWSATWQ